MNLCCPGYHAKVAPQPPLVSPAEQAAAEAETSPLRRKLKQEKVIPG